MSDFTVVPDLTHVASDEPVEVLTVDQTATKQVGAHEYVVIFEQSARVSSDAAVGTHPTATSTVVAELQQAKVAYVTADSVEDAHAAVINAYNSTSVPVVFDPSSVIVPEVVEPPVDATVVTDPVVDPTAAVVTEPGAPVVAGSGPFPSPVVVDPLSTSFDPPSDPVVVDPVIGAPVVVEPVV
jgi:hypothetical protein